jgi:hypothetical protein
LYLVLQRIQRLDARFNRPIMAIMLTIVAKKAMAILVGSTMGSTRTP